MNHRYTLQQYKGPSSRHKCPDCGKPKMFALYIDNNTGEAVNDKVGRCNRESGCGYHYRPRDYFLDNNINQEYSNDYTNNNMQAIKTLTYIPEDILKQSLTGYSKNNFILFLKNLFEKDIVDSLIVKYKIASSGMWPGATTFWYIDTIDRISYGKIMVYDYSTGKRDKKKIDHCASVIEKHHAQTKTPTPEWVVNYQNNESKINCFFGEHLLKLDPAKPVAIVESEKTAIIASVYLPEYIWLAVGSLSFLNAKRLIPLSGRSVTLFPDLGSPGQEGDLCLDKMTGQIYKKDSGIWELTNEVLDIAGDIDKTRFQHFGIEKTKSSYIKWKEIGDQFWYKTSDILENTATSEERKAQLDIADYLMKLNVSDFNITRDDTIQAPNDFDITPELLELHTKYKDAELSGSLQHHLELSMINSLWEGVVLYRNKPGYQQHYIEQLKTIIL